MQTGYGQNTTLSSGATASGTGGTSDYSVGQVFILLQPVRMGLPTRECSNPIK